MSLIHRVLFIAGCGLFLSGCTPTVAPVEQMESKQVTKPVPKLATTKAQRQTHSLYQCKKEISVKVQRVQATKATATRKATTAGIIVSLGDISHKLSPAVTKIGKKYSNIRWIWTEQNGVATLQDSRGKMLAEGCIKAI